MGLLPNESFLLSSTDVRTKDRQLWQTKQKSIKSINDKVLITFMNLRMRFAMKRYLIHIVTPRH